MSENDKAVYGILAKTLEYLRWASEQVTIHRECAGDKAKLSDQLLSEIDKTVADCKDVMSEYRKACTDD